MNLALTFCCHIGLPSLGCEGSIWAMGEEQFGSSDGETVLKSCQYTQRNQRCSSQHGSSPRALWQPLEAAFRKLSKGCSSALAPLLQAGQLRKQQLFSQVSLFYTDLLWYKFS